MNEKEEQYHQEILKKGKQITTATKIMKTLCKVVIAIMSISTAANALFSAIWIFCHENSAQRSGWVRYILETKNRGDYNTSLAELLTRTLEASAALVMIILAYHFFKFLETQITPLTEPAILKLRWTGMWIILLQMLVLLGSTVIYAAFGVENTLVFKDIIPVILGLVLVVDSFVMKYDLERHRK